jgi:protein O-GlcNAc transferase
VELADFYLANSRLEEGMKECLEELALNPHSSAAKLRIGRIHVQLLKAKEALPYLLDGLKTDTDNAGGHTDLARAYELLREWEKAIEQYKAALDLDPSLNRVHYVLARIYRQLGREDQAKREVEIFRSTEAKDRERRTQEIQKLRKRDAPTKQTP